jgi:hypothetical protein
MVALEYMVRCWATEAWRDVSAARGICLLRGGFPTSRVGMTLTRRDGSTGRNMVDQVKDLDYNTKLDIRLDGTRYLA